ncbi:MAG: heavy-metal-associated domain-containing protein [Mesotoga sp.]|jgi:copper chaperone CopZ|uniref:Cation transport ATPases n=1 Tax=uncultured Thermotogales bacterium TaxID=221214 RepID=Q1EM44_9BACT|nr:MULTISPECIES: heavy-metal-associated domain-containing protein [unclassified Mesotoga]MDI9366973.1 heavy-metal-associated domain-containing protein [Thermotogota bacterium]NLT44179.1 heavy-metal-associated domain-containing protein [Thermotogaceae bacterium]CAJ75700.1 cation transport ATPases [uncultured Thermotogales bacterium]MDD2334639.1 heavy-metal-associated domain-containing protein [Mesotoga sp.]MDD3680561.1 heavy-metal-associated domain-containing protein [Mesotoga sp.]
MPRVIRLFQIRNEISENDAEKIVARLRLLDGIVKAQADVASGVIEVEYENAIIDRYIIQEELSELGFDMLI